MRTSKNVCSRVSSSGNKLIVTLPTVQEFEMRTTLDRMRSVCVMRMVAVSRGVQSGEAAEEMNMLQLEGLFER